MAQSKAKKSAYIKEFWGRFLDILRLAGMGLLAFLLIYGTFKIFTDAYAKREMEKGITRFLIFFTIVIVGEIILHKLKDATWQVQANARNEIEFDENGLFRAKNNIQKLSKAEREEIGKRQLAEVERVLGTGTLRKITKDGSDDPEADLKAMMGLAPVKRKVQELQARMEFEHENHTSMDNGHHMCFFGSPGTGKTTIAGIMTGILYKNRVIKKNQFIETDGNFLRGDNPRETSEKINLLVRFARGKVLFIDEAYSMFDGGGSQDIIATLIKLMEDHRKDFVLIIAGYEDEMKELIEANPGFKSRISEYLYFPDYTNDELCNIFSSMANAHNFYVPQETRERLMKRFENERRQKYFGNARTARNVLDEAVSLHALNLKEGKIKPDNKFKIMPSDISVNASAY